MLGVLYRILHSMADIYCNAALFIDRVEWLVVDESDKLFEDGVAGFRDQVCVCVCVCVYVCVYVVCVCVCVSVSFVYVCVGVHVLPFYHGFVCEMCL